MGPFYFHLFGFILFVLMRGINITAHLYARMNDTVETRKLIIGGSRGPILCSVLGRCGTIHHHWLEGRDTDTELGATEIWAHQLRAVALGQQQVI